MTLRVTEEQAARWAGATTGASRVGVPPRSKYRAVAVIVDGFRFASKAEARRYQQLVIQGLVGQIRNLELQPRFDLHVNGRRVGTYVADFRYDELVSLACESTDGRPIVAVRDVIEDVKGVRTAVYKLKKRLFEAEYGLLITEVGRQRRTEGTR